jgi:hypothetical protein
MYQKIPLQDKELHYGNKRKSENNAYYYES